MPNVVYSVQAYTDIWKQVMRSLSGFDAAQLIAWLPSSLPGGKGEAAVALMCNLRQACQQILWLSSVVACCSVQRSALSIHQSHGIQYVSVWPL